MLVAVPLHWVAALASSLGAVRPEQATVPSPPPSAQRVANEPMATKCARCGRDWTAELETRLQRESSDYWQVMCSCGAQLSAESSGADIHLLAGLEWRPA